ncbi:sodium/hydrogen exchanger 9B2 [Magallana gigas]|uniref:sodium/hydrogen exchanger 9B2 n=1 Tax=Magallana gigas TaxID=29159 RepID=UPI003341E3B5
MAFQRLCSYKLREFLAMLAQFTMLMVMIWTTALSITDRLALPGGHLFSLLVLFTSAVAGGYIFSRIYLPPLLGMVIAGFALSNVPVLSEIGHNISPVWSGALRRMALTVILIRAGLGLDPVALRKLSATVSRLAFLPCLLECLTCAVVSHFLMDLPWVWAFLLGFVLSAISPAVVVPSLLSLAERGFGLDKGIPTLVIAAASIDDVVAISGFGISLGIAFSTGDLAWTIAKGPLEALLGIAYGCILGICLWFIPAKNSSNLVFFRAMLLFTGGLLATFGSTYIDMAGAGPLGCLVLPFVSGIRWRKMNTPEQTAAMTEAVGLLWMIFQPVLFGLIGAAVRIEQIQDPYIVGFGVAVLASGLLVRCSVTFLAVLRSGLNLKEQIFVSLAWIPKATVQAAIGGLALDQAIKDKNETLKPLGLTVLTMAVLSIIITAPIGALAIAISGPRFLKSDHLKNESSCSSNDHQDSQDSQEKDEKIVIETETVGEKPCLTEAADVVTHI